MTVTPAELRRMPDDDTPVFVPYATETPDLAEHDYVQEEWLARGVEDGHPYATTICVRRPRDVARFSGGHWDFTSPGHSLSWSTLGPAYSGAIANKPIGRFDAGATSDVVVWNARQFDWAASGKGPLQRLSRQDMK